MGRAEKSTRPFFLWAPVVVYMALMFSASSVHQPPDLPTDSAYTGLHVFEYAGLSALLVRALAGGWGRYVSRRTAVTAILIAILYGITDEIHQRFVPPRQMDPMDLAADALGATLAGGALYARRNSSRRTAAP